MVGHVPTLIGWISIPSRGSRNSPSRFMLQKPEISSGAMSQSALRLRLGTKSENYSHATLLSLETGIERFLDTPPNNLGINYTLPDLCSPARSSTQK